MNVSGSDVCEEVDGRLIRMGFETPGYEGIMNALHQVTFIKDEHVPVVLVADNYVFEDADEAEEFVVVVVRMTVTIDGHEIETDATLRGMLQSDATPETINQFIKFAKQYAKERNYRLETKVKPEDY